MDKLTKEQRHLCMASIRGKYTKPEIQVRRFLFSRGFRYRLNHPRLPGHPDIVLRKYRTVIFVNGCFWHGHDGCKYYVVPKSNTKFWTAKIERNRTRDKEEQHKLAAMGWHEESLGRNAAVGGFQGQRQWTDHWPNCDYPEALLSSTFDYEGAREPFTLATENDILNGLGMLFMRLLTNRAQIFADVRTYWSPEATKRVTGYDLEGKAKENGGIIHLLNSGAACLDACGECTDENGNAVMKRWWEVDDADIKKMTDATVWCEAGFDNFRGGGFSSHFVTRAEMPATMIRLNLVKGLGPVLQIAEGWTVKLPDEVTDTLMERTNPTWPCTWFTPRCDGKSGSPFESAYSVMQNWGANHGAISYGHVGADLITLCSMLRIPVCMHNVADKDVFRPAAWNAFGMDKEGQDYRACAAYGPMYKNIR